MFKNGLGSNTVIVKKNWKDDFRRIGGDLFGFFLPFLFWLVAGTILFDFYLVNLVNFCIFTSLISLFFSFICFLYAPGKGIKIGLMVGMIGMLIFATFFYALANPAFY